MVMMLSTDAVAPLVFAFTSIANCFVFCSLHGGFIVAVTLPEFPGSILTSFLSIKNELNIHKNYLVRSNISNTFSINENLLCLL